MDIAPMLGRAHLREPLMRLQMLGGPIVHPLRRRIRSGVTLRRGGAGAVGLSFAVVVMRRSQQAKLDDEVV